MGFGADNNNGGYFATHIAPVAKPTQREIWEMIAEDLDAFSVRFLRLNAANLADLPERPWTPSGGIEEQNHEWFLVFQNFIAEAEMQLSRQMTRHGLLKEPQFEEGFLDWAEHTDALGPFLRLIDYKGFINRARQCRENLTEPVAKRWEEVLEPNAAQRFKEIEARLAALEAEQSELIRERRWLLGRPEHDEQPSAGKALQCQIERQRYKNEVGMD